jgi:hypothetical protein
MDFRVLHSVMSVGISRRAKTARISCSTDTFTTIDLKRNLNKARNPD